MNNNFPELERMYGDNQFHKLILETKDYTNLPKDKDHYKKKAKEYYERAKAKKLAQGKNNQPKRRAKK